MPISCFAQKCHEMVSAGHSTIGWSPAGDMVWVSNPERLAREHIPAYYDHSSYASWTRALHAHSFRKLTPSTWSHPDFHRDRPESASSIVRKRPPHRGGPRIRAADPLFAVAGNTNSGARQSRVSQKEEELLHLPPLRATESEERAGAAVEDATTRSATSSAVAPPPLREEPSPEVAARLRKLRERIVQEKQAVREMRTMLEALEAHATRARREELQLRHSVVHLAKWIATAAMESAVHISVALVPTLTLVGVLHQGAHMLSDLGVWPIIHRSHLRRRPSHSLLNLSPHSSPSVLALTPFSPTPGLAPTCAHPRPLPAVTTSCTATCTPPPQSLTQVPAATFHDTSTTPPRHFHDTSTTLPRHFHDTSLRRHLRARVRPPLLDVRRERDQDWRRAHARVRVVFRRLGHSEPDSRSRPPPPSMHANSHAARELSGAACTIDAGLLSQPQRLSLPHLLLNTRARCFVKTCSAETRLFSLLCVTKQRTLLL